MDQSGTRRGKQERSEVQLGAHVPVQQVPELRREQAGASKQTVSRYN